MGSGVVLTVTVGGAGSGGTDGGGSPAGTGTEGGNSSISGTGLQQLHPQVVEKVEQKK